MRSLLKKMDKALISFDKSCKGKFAMSRAPSPANAEARCAPGENQYTVFGSGPAMILWKRRLLRSRSISALRNSVSVIPFAAGEVSSCSHKSNRPFGSPVSAHGVDAPFNYNRGNGCCDLLQDFVESVGPCGARRGLARSERPIIFPKWDLHEFCEALQRALVVARVDIGVGRATYHSCSVLQKHLRKAGASQPTARTNAAPPVSCRG